MVGVLAKLWNVADDDTSREEIRRWMMTLSDPRFIVVVLKI